MSKIDDYKAELSRYLESFGDNVRRVRTDRYPHFSQEKLSDATGLHRTEIGKIEQGAVEPRLTTLVILANALGVTLDELVSGLGVPKERKPAPRAQQEAEAASQALSSAPTARSRTTNAATRTPGRS